MSIMSMSNSEIDMVLSTPGNRLGVLLRGVNHYLSDPKCFLKEYYQTRRFSSFVAENILRADLELINFLHSECCAVSGSRYVYDYDKFESEARRRLGV